MTSRDETRYTPPSGSGAAWVAAALREIRESHIGPVPVAIELNGGRGTVLGLLASVPGVPETEADCEVAVDVAGEPSIIACRDIAAFTVGPLAAD